MSNFYFCGFTGADALARVMTVGEPSIPVNVHIENADSLRGAQPGPCRIDLMGFGYGIKCYPSKEAYYNTGTLWDANSLVPLGVFTSDGKGNTFEPSSVVLFTGKVLDASCLESETDNELNCCAAVESLGVEFTLFLHTDVPITNGSILHGTAWLFGILELEGGEEP